MECKKWFTIRLQGYNNNKARLVHKARISIKTIGSVLSIEECSRKCLLSPACDMFYYSSKICKFYPNIKLKGRLSNQVNKQTNNNNKNKKISLF